MKVKQLNEDLHLDFCLFFVSMTETWLGFNYSLNSWMAIVCYWSECVVASKQFAQNILDSLGVFRRTVVGWSPSTGLSLLSRCPHLQITDPFVSIKSIILINSQSNLKWNGGKWVTNKEGDYIKHYFPTSERFYLFSHPVLISIQLISNQRHTSM